MRRSGILLLAVMALVVSGCARQADDLGPPLGAPPTTVSRGVNGEGILAAPPGGLPRTTLGNRGIGSRTAATPPPPPTAKDPGNVGSFATTILRADAHFEVIAQEGAEPEAASLEHMITAVRQIHRGSVQLSPARKITSDRTQWTIQQLIEQADAVGSPQRAGAAIVHMLFVRGQMQGAPGVLGVAMRGDVMAVFSDRVEASRGVLGERSPVERAVVLHEIGHLLGLVDIVLQSGREDPEHPGHSASQESVMFWAIESDAIGAVLGPSPPDSFDAQDKADLERIRDLP